jgi:hypothetical protein
VDGVVGEEGLCYCDVVVGASLPFQPARPSGIEPCLGGLGCGIPHHVGGVSRVGARGVLVQHVELLDAVVVEVGERIDLGSGVTEWGHRLPRYSRCRR